MIDTGLIHTVAAFLALGLGPVVFALRKGTALHRHLGRIWGTAMLILNASALMTYDINGAPTIFHAFVLLNLSALIPGLLAIRRASRTGEARDLEKHVRLMAWAYFGLLAAGLFQLVDQTVDLRFSSWGEAIFWMVGTVMALNIAYARLVQRHAGPLTERYSPIVKASARRRGTAGSPKATGAMQ